MGTEKKSESTDTFFNRSLERSLTILGAFRADRKTYTLAQLAETVGLPKPTVIRLCSTLIKYDFMKYDPESMQYSLGMKLFELGNIVGSSLSLRNAASPHLLQLQVRSGRTAFLGVLRNDEVIYLDKKEDVTNQIRFVSEMGTRRPPYFGMFGQLLLAFLPEDEVDRILARHPLTSVTRKSISDPIEFRERLKQIRGHGYIVEEGEAIEGVTGIAAPVRDSSGDVVASVGVSFISISVEGKNIVRILEEVLKTARAISQDLGYADEDDPANGSKGTAGSGDPYNSLEEGHR
jgi:IclR family transcriptional regulator, KDG regulon repressor